MAYLLKKVNFYFRVGEKPEGSMRSMLEGIGVRVITSHMIPLSLSGGMRMEIFIDKLDKETEDINASLDVHTGYLCVPTTVWVGDPADNPPPPPPIPPFYTRLIVGTRLRVVRESGMIVYLNPGLTQQWGRGVVEQGNISMILALLYDATKDTTPPVGVLCVLKPAISLFFPSGLWIASIGPDGFPNVEAA